MPVDVRPAGLHHANRRIGELMDRPQQEIFRGHEVGVEDGYEFSLGGLHAFG